MALLQRPIVLAIELPVVAAVVAVAAFIAIAAVAVGNVAILIIAITDTDIFAFIQLNNFPFLPTFK